ncbi:MAG: hypothetical protein ABI186_03970 [Candidatus Elarobacter sp.]
MLFTPAVLAVLVEDRHCTVARELAFARRTGLRHSVADAVHRIGAGLTQLGDVLDEQPGPGNIVAVDPGRSRAR